MESVIKLNSRDGTDNRLEKLFTTNYNSSKSFLLVSPYPFNIINDGKEIKAVDPAGGPMISIGTEVEEAKAVVKKISIVDGLGAVITFE